MAKGQPSELRYCPKNLPPAPVDPLRLHIAAGPLLQHPAVAIRIGEVSEAGLVSTRRVESGCESSVPSSNGRLVPDLADLYPTFEQAVPRGLQVRYNEINIAK